MNAAVMQRSIPATIADVQAASQRLSIATRSWSTVTPTRAAVDECLTTAHGLQRALTELSGLLNPRRAA